MYTYVEREGETPKRFKRNLTFARIFLFYLGAAVCATLLDCQRDPSGTHTLADLNRGQQLPIAIWLWVKCLGIPELDGSLNIIKYWICFRSSSVEGPIRVWSPFQSSGQIVLFYGCWMFGFTTLPLPLYHRTLIRRPVMTCTNITWQLTHTRTQKSQSAPCASIQTPEITSPSILPQAKRA